MMGYEYGISLIDFLSSVISVIILPTIIGMFTWLDKRNAKKGKSRDEFNLILLEGLDSIGKIAMVTADAQKGKETNGQLDRAIESYEEFEAKMAEFKNKSVKKVVRG